MTPAKRLVMMGFVQVKNELVYTPATWAEWLGIGASSGTSVVDNYLVIENESAELATVAVYLNCNFKPNTKYGMLLHVRFNTRTSRVLASIEAEYDPFENEFSIPPGEAGNFKYVDTTKAEFSKNRIYIWTSKSAGRTELGKYRVFELPAGSQIEWDFENLNADQLNAKYPF